MAADLNSPTFRAELKRHLRAWQPEFIGTLLFICVGGELLLIHKKRGHGAGKVNAPGGKVHAGETPLACALRETWEEVGIKVRNASLMGELKFLDRVDSQWLGHVFVASKYEGTPVETAEARPFWVPLDRIPYDEMWEVDRIWLPEILAGRLLRGEFLFDAGRLLSYTVRQW